MSRPYVYSVHAHDIVGFRRAIHAALTNPIDSYIPNYMQFDYACHKMAEVVEMDWMLEGQKVRQERLNSGTGEVSQHD